MYPVPRENRKILGRNKTRGAKIYGSRELQDATVNKSVAGRSSFVAWRQAQQTSLITGKFWLDGTNNHPTKRVLPYMSISLHTLPTFNLNAKAGWQAKYRSNKQKGGKQEGNRLLSREAPVPTANGRVSKQHCFRHAGAQVLLKKTAASAGLLRQWSQLQVTFEGIKMPRCRYVQKTMVCFFTSQTLNILLTIRNHHLKYSYFSNLNHGGIGIFYL